MAKRNPKEETPAPVKASETQAEDSKSFSLTLELEPTYRHKFRRLAESRKKPVGELLAELIKAEVNRSEAPEPPAGG